MAARNPFFGFGTKPAVKGKAKTGASKKRSTLTAGQALHAAYNAGRDSGDTGHFDEWLTKMGLADRGDVLRNALKSEYRYGVKGYIGPGEAQMVRTARAGLAKNPRKRKNPESGAADLYETFHGVPSEGVTEIVTEIHEHEWLTQLGILVELVIDTETGGEATISFDDQAESADAVRLASSEDGNSYYFEGGDQELDLKAMKFGDEWIKDLMVIGRLENITYRTRKQFDDLEETDYTHEIGEALVDGKRRIVTDVKPTVLYDSRNCLLMLAGGVYATKDVGIIR